MVSGGSRVPPRLPLAVGLPILAVGLATKLIWDKGYETSPA